MTLRLLAVHAHPDDESSKGSATYAYYRSLGAEVLVVSCTGGEQGSILNEQLEARAHAERDIAGPPRARDGAAPGGDGRPPPLARLRRLRAARRGRARRGQLVRDDPARDQRRAARRASSAGSGPQVLVTYDEIGGYPHPDHIRTHEISMEAFRARVRRRAATRPRASPGRSTRSTTTACSAPAASAR